MVELFAREGVGGDDMQRMSFHRADQRQRHTRAAARIFDDRSVRSEPPVVFRRFDHGERLAVLHSAGGVLAFELERSDEGRVGPECVSTCRSRWSLYHDKKK